MIASLRGTIIHIGIDHAVLETGGVGYLVYAPRSVLGGLSAGEAAFLYTVLIVREDAMTLYGFTATEQRTLFEQLLSVTGVGPKVALSVLSAGSLDEMRAAIGGGDVTRLAKVPGIGKKTAERLVLELKGKIDLRGLSVPSVAAAPAPNSLNADLIDLLTSLGYSSAEASAAVAALPADAPANLEDRLRLALRYFGGM